MASSAWWAYGTEFQLNDGTAPITVAEIIDINGPGISRDTMDVSNQDGSAGYREFLPGWRNGGEITITANWIPKSSTHNSSAGILSNFLDDDVHDYKIAATDVTIEFSGIITNFGVNLPLSEQAKVEFGVQITGPVTIA